MTANKTETMGKSHLTIVRLRANNDEEPGIQHLDPVMPRKPYFVNNTERNQQEEGNTNRSEKIAVLRTKSVIKKVIQRVTKKRKRFQAPSRFGGSLMGHFMLKSRSSSCAAAMVCVESKKTYYMTIIIITSSNGYKLTKSVKQILVSYLRNMARLI